MRPHDSTSSSPPTRRLPQALASETTYSQAGLLERPYVRCGSDSTDTTTTLARPRLASSFEKYRREIRRSRSKEFCAVLVEKFSQRARGTAGDLLEGVGRVVVLTGEDRPLARDQQFSFARRYAGVDEPLEDLALVSDA